MNKYNINDKRFRLMLREELNLRKEQGCNIEAMKKKIDAHPGEMSREKCLQFYDEIGKLKGKYDESNEPSDYARIAAARPKGPRAFKRNFSHATLKSKLLGAWHGRCIGCLLGKPVEGWDMKDIELMGRLTSGYPLKDYLGAVYPPPSDEINPRFKRLLTWRFTDPEWKSVKEFLPNGMPIDDDTSYTVLYTLLLEKHGATFTTEDVADFWLARFPYRAVQTAEKIAYRNLINNIPPPECARYLNPGRELIGAQIRGDAFGYIAPGMPEKAAIMAYKDARLSHVQNGIYGEMWVAAMLATAFISSDVFEIIETGLTEIPKDSRLAKAIRKTVSDWKKTRNWKKTMSTVERLYGKQVYHEGHTINNAAVVAIGLMEGARDFEQGVTRSVMCGYDTDCNGATVGSILGLMHGHEAIDSKWTDPLKDTIYTRIAEFNEVEISGMVQKSLALAIRMLMDDVKPEAIAANELKSCDPRDNYWELPNY